MLDKTCVSVTDTYKGLNKIPSAERKRGKGKGKESSVLNGAKLHGRDPMCGQGTEC